MNPRAATHVLVAALLLGSPVAVGGRAAAEPVGAPVAVTSRAAAEPAGAPAAVRGGWSAAGAAGPGLSIAITLRAAQPSAPQPGQTLVVRGRLRNASRAPVGHLQVQLRIGSMLTSRYAVAAFATDVHAQFGVPLSQTATAVRPPSLRPGASASFRIRLPVDQLGLAGPGVFQFGVEVLGVPPGSTAPGTVGLLRTFLPWAPTSQICRPLRLAWLWPLVDRPHLTSGRTFLDDTLAGSLRPGGRLGRLLAVAAAASRPPAPPHKRSPGRRTRRRRGRTHATHPRLTVPVTWVIDPMLVDDARIMARGYLVAVAGHRPTRGHGDRTAARWLAALRTATSHGEVLALPYADPDIVALVHGGLEPDALAAFRAGLVALSRDLPVVPDQFYWPPDGEIDQAASAAVFAGPVDGLVLSSAALPAAPRLTYTPTARVTIPLAIGSLPAVVTDQTLDRVVQGGAVAGADSALENQRFLAETLLVDEELPCASRDLVVAPGRYWAPSASYAASLLRDTVSVPWLRAVPLSRVLADPAGAVPRQPLLYPVPGTPAQLSVGYVRLVHGIRARLDALEAVLPVGASLDRPLELALFRAESSAWRDDPVGAANFRDGVSRMIDRLSSSVRIASSGLYTLSSRSGTIPITVLNNLSLPVRVVLHLDPGSHARIPGGDQLPVRVPAGRAVQVPVHTVAQTAGVFQLRVQLYAPTGAAYGPPVELLVRSTAFGAVALGITGGALGVLVLALLARLVRRLRRGHPTPVGGSPGAGT